MEENSIIKNDMLETLTSIWDEIGFTVQEKQSRLKKLNHSIRKYIRKLEHEECHVKEELIRDIDHLGHKILKLSTDLHQSQSITEPDLNGTLLEVQAELEKQLIVLQQEAHRRTKLLTSLKREEMELCERLGEDPWDGPMGELPSEEELTYFASIIKTLEKQKDHREKVFRTLKAEILKSMETLEQDPTTSLQRDVVYEVEEIVTLSSYKINEMKSLAASLASKIEANSKTEESLKNDIQSLWERLEIDVDTRNELINKLTDKCVRNIPMLESEFQRLEALKLKNMGKFIDQLKTEVEEWWNKCFISEPEREKFQVAVGQDISEDTLTKYEEELKLLREKYTKYSSVYSKLHQWCQLWGTVTTLEEKAHDPNRLFGNRGCSLLQEEKERKRVTKELPKIERELKKLIQAIELEEGRVFEVCGLILEDFFKHQWASYNEKKLQEKKERQEARAQQLMIDAKLSRTRSTKRPNNAKEPNQTSKFRRTGEHNRTPVAQRTMTRYGSVTSLASNRPILRDRNATIKSSGTDDTFQNSTCSYNKFTQGIRTNQRENMRSSILANTRTPRGLPRTPVRTPQRSSNRLRCPKTLPPNFGQRRSPRVANASAIRSSRTPLGSRSRPGPYRPITPNKLSFLM